MEAAVNQEPGKTTVPGDPAWRERQAAQAQAFDRIGERYDEAFPHKQGQLAAGEWLIGRLRSGDRVLDLGCGTGIPTARQLADAGLDVTGVDLSPGMLDLARRNVPQAAFRQLDIASLSGDEEAALGRFHGILAFFSLLMLPRSRVPAVLRRIHRLLEPGGHLTLGMVEADVDDVPIEFLGHPIRVSGYRRDDLRTLLYQAGFTVLDLWDVAYDPVGPGADPEVQLFAYCRAEPRPEGLPDL